MQKYASVFCIGIFGLTSACGGVTTSNQPLSVSQINEDFDALRSIAALAQDDGNFLDSSAIAAKGSASYRGLAGIGYDAEDTGGLLGRLSLEVEFGAEPTVSGHATGFVVVPKALQNATPDQVIADGSDLKSVTGELTYSNGSIVTQDDLSLLAFDVDGTVAVPTDVGLAAGDGSLVIDGQTAGVVLDNAILSDFVRVNATLDGTPVLVGVSIYAFED